MKTKIFLAAAVFLFAVTPALAAPTIASEDDQSFDQHENIKQVRDITITDDSTSPQITASGDIRIRIPESFPVIWDDRVNSVNLSGSAVDAGRFANGTAAVSYEDADKTAVIDVAEDFTAGESVKVAGLFIEGFYWADANARLELILQSGGSAVAFDSKALQVWISTNIDTHEPEAPSAIQLTQTTENTVKITWTDSPDMDVSQIQILRGVAPLPVSGTPFTEVGDGEEEFIDTDIEIGDTVSYILRSTDGRNLSALSEELSITLTESTAPIACTMEYVPVCGSDEKTYGNSCSAEAAGIAEYITGECPTEPPAPLETPEAIKADEAGITVSELQNAISSYSDLESDHWSAGFLARLTRDDILDGYPDGTVQPDTTINRAELAKIATNSFALNTSVSVSRFIDVPAGSWFDSFVKALKAAGASWTSGENYFPADGVSRGEAVWVLLQSAGVEMLAVSEKPFPDVSTSHPYAAAIDWAKINGIINGYDDGTFGIRDTLTRAQVAKIITLIKDL